MINRVLFLFSFALVFSADAAEVFNLNLNIFYKKGKRQYAWEKQLAISTNDEHKYSLYTHWLTVNLLKRNEENYFLKVKLLRASKEAIAESIINRTSAN